MQALLLPTNQPPRLKPLTDTIPLPLLPIVSRTVIHIVLDHLTDAGIKQIVLGQFNGSDAVSASVGDGHRWSAQIVCPPTQQSDFAAALRVAALQSSGTIIILPVDAILDFDITLALNQHRDAGAVLTLVSQRGSGQVAGLHWLDNSAEIDCIGSAYLVEPQALAHVTNDMVHCQDLFERLLAAGEPVASYRIDGYWNLLSTFAAYQEAQHVFLDSAYRPNAGTGADERRIRNIHLPGRQVRPGVWIGPHSSVRPSAVLIPPVWVGERCWIGDDVELGPYTVIEPHVIVGDQATVRQSTVLSHTALGRLINSTSRIICGDILIDPASGDHIQIVDPFLLAAAPTKPRRTWLGRLSRLLTSHPSEVSELNVGES